MLKIAYLLFVPEFILIKSLAIFKIVLLHFMHIAGYNSWLWVHNFVWHFLSIIFFVECVYLILCLSIWEKNLFLY